MSDANPASIEGGCLCGAVRYRATAAPLNSMMCHCNSCRRAAGAPVVAWITFPSDAFTFTNGTPNRYASSAGVVRTFCPGCGTPLTYVHQGRPGDVDVTTASLDHPDRFPPTWHGWLEDTLPWLRFGDDLPTHRKVPSAE